MLIYMYVPTYIFEHTRFMCVLDAILLEHLQNRLKSKKYRYKQNTRSGDHPRINVPFRRQSNQNNTNTTTNYSYISRQFTIWEISKYT